MTSEAVNTKVERVVEAWEDLALATAVAVFKHKGSIEGLTVRNYEAVLTARKSAADALREFLQPILRVAK